MKPVNSKKPKKKEQKKNENNKVEKEKKTPEISNFIENVKTVNGIEKQFNQIRGIELCIEHVFLNR